MHPPLPVPRASLLLRPLQTLLKTIGSWEREAPVEDPPVGHTFFSCHLYMQQCARPARAALARKERRKKLLTVLAQQRSRAMPAAEGFFLRGEKRGVSSQSPGHMNIFRVKVCQSHKVYVHALCFPPRAGPHRVRWPHRLVLRRRRRCRPHAIRLGGREWQRWPVTLCWSLLRLCRRHQASLCGPPALDATSRPRRAALAWWLMWPRATSTQCGKMSGVVYRIPRKV